MFQNQGWEIPSDLGAGRAGYGRADPVESNRAVSQISGGPKQHNRERHEQAFVHLVEHLGQGLPVKKIWIPQIKEYQIDRLNEGAAASTVNKEKAALSKMFQVLIELRHVDVNPARLVKPLSEKSGKEAGLRQF